MRLHHVLIDTTSALQYCQASETSNRVQIVSKDLHAVILNLLQSAKCENFTFHAFTSLLPSAPLCQTLQMSPRTLQNLKSEIATNLRLAAMEPPSASGSDGNASVSGLVKVLQRLMRKLSSSRNMYSAKPPKHTVYLFGCVPGSGHEIPCKTRAARDTSQGQSASQSSNTLCETLEKLKGLNIHLVWICLGPPYQLHRTTLSVSAKKNPLDSWAQNKTHIEIKYFADLSKPSEPARRPLAFSLQKRLGIAAQVPESQKMDFADCDKARIVVERGDEQNELMLLCISNVRVLSLHRTMQRVERATTFVLSHYLKKWDSPSSEKTLAGMKPRTLKPKGADDSEAFSSFMSFLMQTETVVVANELTVDDKKQNVESRPVMIVPYTSNIASVCHITFPVKPHRCQGSPLPKNYHQWREWHCGGQAKKIDLGLLADKPDEVYGMLLSTNSPGSSWQESSNANGIGNPLSLKHDIVRSGNFRRHGDLEVESAEVQLVPSIQEEISVGKVIRHAKEPSLKKSGGLLSSPTACVVSKCPGIVVSDGKPRVPVTVTKNGFRYKRVSVKNSPFQQSVTVHGKESIVSEPRNPSSLISNRRRSLVSKSFHATGNQSEMRYKGDGKKKISVDTAILCREKEALFLGKLRNINGCEPKDSSRTSNEESTGYSLIRRKPEAEAVQFEDGLEATCEVESNQSSPADENSPRVLPSTDTLTKAIGQFDNLIAELSNPSIKQWEPIVGNAMTQLSSISEQLVTARHSWPELNSFAKWRLREVDAIIASMQAEQKTLFPDGHSQFKATNGILWKIVIEAFEQVIWLLMKLIDPDAKISPNPKKKPECFRRATTILSCAQVTAELTSSLFDSSHFFRSVWDSFFNSTLVHFVQASNHTNLNHWTRIVFEHFEMDLPCCKSAANPQTMKQAADAASSSSLSHQKAVVKPRNNLNRNSRGRRNYLSSKASARSLSNLLPERKRTVRKPENLQNHPAFRRGKAFAGVSKKKRKLSRAQPLLTRACSSHMLDKLIHMGSLQSSLDAIKVPEAKDHDFCDEAVEGTDDETEKTLLTSAKKSSYRKSEGSGSTSNAHGSSRQANGKETATYSAPVNLPTEKSLDKADKPYQDETRPTKIAIKLGSMPNSTCVDGEERPQSEKESLEQYENAENGGQNCSEEAERSMSELDGSPATDTKSCRGSEVREVLALRNRMVKRQERGPEASPECISSPKRQNETHHNCHISAVHDVSNLEPEKDAKLSPVKKRKLTLRDDLRPQDQSPKGVFGEPKLKRHHGDEEPKPSFFNRLRKLLPRSINPGNEDAC